jgi:ubiquinone/menaquinone biosynthesis C-methylase UbiE
MDWKKESEMFNQMAEYYDIFRPSYPQEIINAIIDKASLVSGAKLLEIGAGSGKATAQFADYNLEILCVEPGPELAARGRERFIGKNIEFIVSRFEDYSPSFIDYDAIISAQAFHWLPQPEGYEKCAAVLKDGGYLAPFWNIGIIKETKLDKELFDLMETHNAFTSDTTESKYNERMKEISDGISGSGFFNEPEIIEQFHPVGRERASVPGDRVFSNRLRLHSAPIICQLIPDKQVILAS